MVTNYRPQFCWHGALKKQMGERPAFAIQIMLKLSSSLLPRKHLVTSRETVFKLVSTVSVSLAGEEN